MSEEDQQQPHPREQELHSLMENNHEVVNKIRRMGIQIDKEMVDRDLTRVFINWAIERFADGDESVKIDLAIDFEIVWQTHINDALRATKKEANRVRLAARGHQPKGGLIVPGQGE